jgi:hypothetical protein
MMFEDSTSFEFFQCSLIGLFTLVPTLMNKTMELQAMNQHWRISKGIEPQGYWRRRKDGMEQKMGKVEKAIV